MRILKVTPPEGSRNETIRVEGPRVGTARYVKFLPWHAEFTRISDDALEAKVPYFAETSKIVLVDENFNDVVSPEDFKVIPEGASKPVIEGIEPHSGVPGIVVSITGSGLTLPKKVRFGGVEAGLPELSTDTLL